MRVHLQRPGLHQCRCCHAHSNPKASCRLRKPCTSKATRQGRPATVDAAPPASVPLCAAPPASVPLCCRRRRWRTRARRWKPARGSSPRTRARSRRSRAPTSARSTRLDRAWAGPWAGRGRTHLVALDTKMQRDGNLARRRARDVAGEHARREALCQLHNLRLHRQLRLPALPRAGELDLQHGQIRQAHDHLEDLVVVEVGTQRPQGGAAVGS